MSTADAPQRRALLTPVAGIAAALGLAGVLLAVEALLGGPTLPVANARTLLVGTFGALVTIGAFTFWMRPIAAQLAASALPPRTVAQALEDRFQRRIIAATVGALAYEAFVVLFLPTTDGRAPVLPVVTGVALAVTAIVGLLIGMQRAIQATRPSKVLATIASELTDDLRSYGSAPPSTDDVELPEAEGRTVEARSSGWVQSVDESALLRALPAGATVRVEVGEGSFVVEGWTPLLTVWADPPLSDQQRRALGDHLRTGDLRGAHLDVPGALSHLVDVGVHAASGAGSPSMVDEVIWHLGAVLHVAMRTDLAHAGRRSDDGTTLLRARQVDHGELVELAVNRLRRTAADEPVIALQLVEVLRDVRAEALEAGRDDAVAAIDRQLDLCVEQCRHADGLPADVEAVARARADGDGDGDVPREVSPYRGDGHDRSRTGARSTASAASR